MSRNAILAHEAAEQFADQVSKTKGFRPLRISYPPEPRQLSFGLAEVVHPRLVAIVGGTQPAIEVVLRDADPSPRHEVGTLVRFGQASYGSVCVERHTITTSGIRVRVQPGEAGQELEGQLNEVADVLVEPQQGLDAMWSHLRLELSTHITLEPPVAYHDKAFTHFAADIPDRGARFYYHQQGDREDTDIFGDYFYRRDPAFQTLQFTHTAGILGKPRLYKVKDSRVLRSRSDREELEAILTVMPRDVVDWVRYVLKLR